MPRLAAIGAETPVVPAAAFFGGKGTICTPGTVDIHGGGGRRVGPGLTRGTWLNGFGNARRARRGGGMGTGVSGGRLILLNGDGSREVSLKRKGEGASGSELKPYNLLQFP